LLNGQLIGLPVSAQHLHFLSYAAIYQMSRELNSETGPGWAHKIILVAVERPMCNRKTNFRSFIDSHSSNNHEILAKIGLVDVEIIGLIEIVKINMKQRQNRSPPSAAAQPRAG